MNSNKNNRPLNLMDIAKKAGVSKSTVSRVVNGGVNVSQKTLQKVQSIIEEESFVPNPGGRILHMQRTHVIGIVFLHSIDDTFEDPFYFPMFLKGVNQVTQDRGYTTMLWIDTTNIDEEQFSRHILRNRLIDGLLIASSRQNAELVDTLIDLDVMFVMVERPGTHESLVNYVVSDNVLAAYQAVTHLIDNGYQRIATISGRMDHVDGIDRLTGYQNALQDAGMPIVDDLIVEGDFTYAAGYQGMKQLLNQHVDAVFAATDRSAIGAFQAIKEVGLSVPDDIALVGFDDLAQFAQPPILPLTSIQHGIVDKSTQATSVLLDLIEGKRDAPQQLVLPTQLIVRESSSRK